METPASKAFIRCSDGEIFIPHPGVEGRWLSKRMYESNSVNEGWSHWTTKLFMRLVSDGSFEVVWSKYDIETYSDYYKKQRDFNEAKRKYNEAKTGICEGCGMTLHVCLCSHDD
jgi:hypothetical protein